MRAVRHVELVPRDSHLLHARVPSHGGLTADHADGWGLAYVEDRDARVFRDVDAAAASPYLEMVEPGGSI